MRKKGCPDYDKLKHLFTPSTANGHLQISSNTLALNSDEEYALEEEELATDVAPIHLDDNYYTPDLDSIPRITEETDVDQTQAAGKRPMQKASAKGKKVVKKVDIVSAMIILCKHYMHLKKNLVYIYNLVH